MAEKLQIYKCMACGNIVEVLHGGDGELVCCGEPMKNLVAKSTDEGREKHVPVIEKTNAAIRVKVGSIAHPMEQDHYIEWIEILADGRAYRQFLNPSEAPEAIFYVDKPRAPGVVVYKTDNDESKSTITAREHCSIHGLWKGQ